MGTNALGTTIEVFSEFAYTSMTEMLAQQVELFNAATKGALTLQAGQVIGDYSNRLMYAKIAGLVRRRNAYATGAVAHKAVGMLDEVAVKVAAGTPPIDIDPGMFQWIGRTPEEAGVVVGKQLAMDSLADMLNTALAALVPALVNQATNYYDGSAGTMTLARLQSGAAKFGDRSDMLTCWLMHSKALFDIYGTALAGTSYLFQFGTVNVKSDGFGRIFVISDSPALVDATPRYYALGLQPGAIEVTQNPDYQANMDTRNGDENITRTFQAQWSYNLRLKGFAWDKTNGGPSPTAAAIATASNWDMVATSFKDLPGVVVKVQ